MRNGIFGVFIGFLATILLLAMTVITVIKSGRFCRVISVCCQDLLNTRKNHDL